jgi:hypothetical protein
VKIDGTFSVHDDELEGIPFKPSLIKMTQESLPGGLRFTQNLTSAVK